MLIWRALMFYTRNICCYSNLFTTGDANVEFNDGCRLLQGNKKKSNEALDCCTILEFF